MTDRTAPQGVEVRPLTAEAARGVLDEVFGGRRCTTLDTVDPEATQWVIAELGDGRVTGLCPQGRAEWEWEFVGNGDGPPTGAADGAWRLLDLAVFSDRAQVRVGEGAEFAHTAVDTDGPLPDYVKPTTRHLLLLGWRKDHDDAAERAGRARGFILPAGSNGGLVRAKELSGSAAVHPLTVEDVSPGTVEKWTDFEAVEIPNTKPKRHNPKGSWLRVREYWAQDPDTGAVHVAFHRLAGYTTGVITNDEEESW